ncbi:MAG: ABC transporter ATP-binding protein [Pseudomonadota bacterium]
MDKLAETSEGKVAGSAEDEIAIDVQNCTKIFTGETEVRALDNVSVQIRKNEFFTLLGPSGCGKTTLLRLIAGFEHPTSGLINLDGQDISLLPPYQRPVNTVFQSYALFPHMSVSENIAFGLEMLGKPKAEIDDTVSNMLALVKMTELKNRKTSQISGGQQQRVALARALAPKPKVLLLDEPLSALDLKLRKQMQIELKRLQHETGITFVFVTHDQEEALTMSDRVAVMNEGNILQVGPPREIYDHPAERFVANFIGDTNFLTAKINTIQKNGTSAKVDLPSGHQVLAALPRMNGKGADLKGEVTVVVRPEHASLIKSASKAHLTGTLSNIVYIGTDTHYHLQLPDGTPFIVRSQNKRDATENHEIGKDYGLDIGKNAVQILKD